MKRKRAAAYSQLISREDELWGAAPRQDRLSWFDSPTLSRHINLQVSGRPDRDWLDHVFARHLQRPVELGLSVGCGHGELERHLLRRGIAEYMHAFDISPGAIEGARKAAADEGFSDRVEYCVADAGELGAAKLRRDYALVLASMSLHHVAELESCLDGLRERMRIGGLLVVNEFVGPERFQWTDAQLDAANRFLACIPRELRRDRRQPGEYKDRIERPGRRYMEEHFAFEAICSDRIVSATRERFEVVELLPYGGTLLQLLFEAIMGNFDEERVREHAVIVRLAAEYERALIASGSLAHDHVLLIARRVA